MSVSSGGERLDARVDAAWPEAADYLDEHPDRLERVSRALVERVLAAADRVPSPGLDERAEAAAKKLAARHAEAYEPSCGGVGSVSLIGKWRSDALTALEAAGLPQLLSELAEAREENERLAKRANYVTEWYATRWQRLQDELRGTDVWPRVACIMANGTAESTENPTYAQQLNLLRHRAERAESQLADTQAALRDQREGVAYRVETPTDDPFAHRIRGFYPTKAEALDRVRDFVASGEKATFTRIPLEDVFEWAVLGLPEGQSE